MGISGPMSFPWGGVGEWVGISGLMSFSWVRGWFLRYEAPSCPGVGTYPLAIETQGVGGYLSPGN